MPKTKQDDKVELKRVQLDMPPRALSDLGYLKAELEATSYAEVVRRAIKFIRLLISRKKAGAKFLIYEKDGTVTEVIF